MAPLSQGLSLYQSLFFEKEWMSGILEAFLYSSNPDLVRMMATESPRAVLCVTSLRCTMVGRDRGKNHCFSQDATLLICIFMLTLVPLLYKG